MYNRPYFYGGTMAPFPWSFENISDNMLMGAVNVFNGRNEQGLEPFYKYLWNSLRNGKDV